MKKLFLFVLCFVLVGSLSAQLRKIPAVVTEKFTQKYPMATSIEWRDRLTGYIADFSLNDTTYTAYFNNDGDWTSTEHVIGASELPDAIRESYEKSKYADWEMGAVQLIQMPGGIVQYRVQTIRSEIRKRNLYFNPDGRMLRDLVTL